MADSSLRFDLETKGDLYSEAGIPAYWIVDASSPQLIPVIPARFEATALQALLTTIPPTA